MSEVIQNSEEITCVQILKYIVSKHPNPNIYNVLKILYFADREHLLNYNGLMIFDKYIKKERGPVPNLCYDILKFVQDTNYEKKFAESIKKEIEVRSDDTIKNITEPNLYYLAKTSIKCLDKAIEEYKDYKDDQLEIKSHDKIYESVNFNEEITVFDMAKFLDESGELTEYLQETFI